MSDYYYGNQDEPTDIGVVSRSKVFTLISGVIRSGRDFHIKFIDKTDDSIHILKHTCKPAEYMTTPDGTKWKRI